MELFPTVAEKIPITRIRQNRRSLTYCLLLIMILANVAIRYPADHALPYGSDTFTMLELSRQLAGSGHAAWVLTPMSYFGLYPLSYPSGVPFEVAELKVLSGLSWNSVPLVTSLFFAVFFVLVSFVFFRQFRLGNELSAILAGLVSLSPIFVYFTYQEVTGRGFVVPLFLLSLYLIFWSGGRLRARVPIFLLLTFGAFSMHRSGFMIIIMELIAAAVIFFDPYLPRADSRVKIPVYSSLIALGVLFVTWPYVPYLNDFFGRIPEIAFSYRIGELQFQTGLFFEGHSPIILLANLAINYVGGMGLPILLLPAGFVALYPICGDSREKDLFPLLALVIFAPMLWQADYMQLMLLPFAYLVAGLAISRRNRLRALASRMGRRLKIKPRKARTSLRLWPAAIALFMVACLIFSSLMFIHRINIKDPITGLSNWPNDSEVNLGLYVGDMPGKPDHAFVSATGTLDRRVRWFSEWQSPVTDSVVLKSAGYLNATPSDFEITLERGDLLYYLLAFFDFKKFYTLDVPNKDLYDLSYGDIYGYFRLYFLDSTNVYASPHVSTVEAGISIVIEINSMGHTTYNLYYGQGTLKSRLLEDVSSNAYVLYENQDYTAFLAAAPVPG
jgi:hypothetical protein